MLRAVEIERSRIVEGSRERTRVVERDVIDAWGTCSVEIDCVRYRGVVHERHCGSLCDGQGGRIIGAREHADGIRRTAAPTGTAAIRIAA